jgi:hypothetical protein
MIQSKYSEEETDVNELLIATWKTIFACDQ